MPRTSRSLVQIPASSVKFTLLARHRKREILGNNGDIFLALDGEISIMNKKYLSLSALQASFERVTVCS